MSYHVLYLILYIQSYTVYIYIYYTTRKTEKNKNSRFLNSFSISPYHICPHDFPVIPYSSTAKIIGTPHHQTIGQANGGHILLQKWHVYHWKRLIYISYIYILCIYLLIIYIYIHIHIQLHITKIKTRNIAGFHGISLGL
jgi:hypothetical protein